MMFRDQEQLIEEIKKRPCLYNRYDDCYKDLRMKDVKWAEVALAMNTDPKSVRTRWRNLRDRYTKEKKLMMSQSINKRPWRYTEKLGFLEEISQQNDDSLQSVHESLQINSHQITISSHQIVDGSASPPNLFQLYSGEYYENQDSGEEEIEAKPSKMHTCPLSTVEPSETSVDKELPRSSALVKQEVFSADSDIAEPSSSALLIKQQTVDTAVLGSSAIMVKEEVIEDTPGYPVPDTNLERDSSYDEDVHFCMSLLGPLRRLSTHRKSQAKIQIYQLLSEKELEQSLK